MYTRRGVNLIRGPQRCVKLLKNLTSIPSWASCWLLGKNLTLDSQRSTVFSCEDVRFFWLHSTMATFSNNSKLFSVYLTWLGAANTNLLSYKSLTTAHPAALTALYQNTHESGRSGYLLIDSEVANQRRLRVTKGVYLPADVPLHGIFGSKDVIHSWAIPGLGLKIDCIPGYSSHRRLILK